MRTIHEIIEDVLRVEGEDYTNDPADSGGPTKWGWTEKALRDMGYSGEVKDLERDTAYEFYHRRFVERSGYSLLMELSPEVTAELVDTAVNMGEDYAGRFLQVALNAFNDGQKRWEDIREDGRVGPATAKAFRAFVAQRGTEGVVVMLRALNAQQGARYLELSRMYPKNERFCYGWFLNRVMI